MKQFDRGKPNLTGLKNVVLTNKKGLVLDYYTCIYQRKVFTFEKNYKSLLKIYLIYYI